MMKEEKIYRVKCVNCEKEFDVSIKHMEELMSSSHDNANGCALVTYEFQETCPKCNTVNRIMCRRTYDEHGEPIYEVSSLENEKLTNKQLY